MDICQRVQWVAPVPPNASNVVALVFSVRLWFSMSFGDLLPQLGTGGRQLAQLNEPFLAIMGVATHPEGGTAHVSQDRAAALTSPGALVRRLLTRVCLPGAVAASPPAAARPASAR